MLEDMAIASSKSGVDPHRYDIDIDQADRQTDSFSGLDKL